MLEIYQHKQKFKKKEIFKDEKRRNERMVGRKKRRFERGNE